MAEMTDPTDALRSFQAVILAGGLPLQRGALDRHVHVHADAPQGKSRFTYVKLDGRTVTALAVVVADGLDGGLPCFALGYAVPPEYRGQGRARGIVQAAIREMQHGFARTPMTSFYVEAVVGLENVASQRVAEHCVSPERTEITDSVSGQRAYRYVGRFDVARG